MGTPTKKRTSGQRRRRAIHLRLRHRTLAICPKCKHPVLPHRACGFCGYYKGREVKAARTERTKAKATK